LSFQGKHHLPILYGYDDHFPINVLTWEVPSAPAEPLLAATFYSGVFQVITDQSVSASLYITVDVK
jgi:hypothetical protein